jgi:predicted permease
MAMPPPRWIHALYRAVARASPARVRDRVADDQVALFAELWREERPAGAVAAAFWTLAIVGRAAFAAMAMHVDERRRRGPARRRWHAAGDVKHALRGIRRAPWYSSTLIAVIAVGLALTATIFALVDGVLFKPLPYGAPHELYALEGRAGGEAIAGSAVSPEEIEAWRSAAPEVRFTAHGTSIGFGTLGVVNGPTVWSRAVDTDFWDTLGVRPIVGGFAPADYDAELPTRPVVITYGLWQRLFGGDPNVVGRIVTSGRVSLRIAGVLPRSFVFPTGKGQVRPDMLTPAPRGPAAGDARASRTRNLIARVPSSLPMEVLRARLIASMPSNPDATGRARDFDDVELLPLKDVITADHRMSATLAFGAGAMMVLLVAVNVSGLVAGRSLDRVRESAARRALGASSADLMRLHMIEIGVLVTIAAGLGLVLARYALIETTRRLPHDIVLLREPAIDGRVAAAVLVAATVVALAATWMAVRVPARRALTTVLGQGAGAAAAPARTFARSMLLAVQVGLALVLVTGGALFLASLHTIWGVDTGYDLTETIYVDVRVTGVPGTATPLARSLELVDILRGVPGVSSAAVIDTLLLSSARRGSPLAAPPGVRDEAEMIPVSSQFFQIAGLIAIEGRLPSHAELDGGAPVAVVSARTARDFWPGRSAVGQLLGGRGKTLSVVGVVRDSRFEQLDQPSRGQIFVPMRLGLWTSPAPTYLIRSTLPAETIIPAVLETIRRFDPTSSIRRAETVPMALAESIRPRRFQAWLFGMMGASGLIVIAAGILGVVAAATARRTREMGVRIALGSTPAALSALMLREQLAPVVAGLAGGGVLAAILARYVQSFLYEVSAYDVGVWLSAAGLVLIVASIGTLVPASRAASVDPVAALRAE